MRKDGREGQGRGRREGRARKGRVEEGDFRAFTQFKICHYTTAHNFTRKGAARTEVSPDLV